MRLDGKVIVITGAASGIGKACATRYASEGAKVVLADINQDAGEVAVREIRTEGGEAVFQFTEVGETAALESLLARALSEYGDVHAWHNNAFASVFKPITEQTLEEFDSTMRVSVRAYWYGSKLAVTHMLERSGGVIINTASVAAFDGQIGQAAYSASKGGVVGMTLPIARELAHYGIRVVTVAPGIFDTPMLAGLPEKARQSLAVSVPFPSRLGTPEDYAKMAQHIVENEMLNGEVIRLDGALRMAPK